MNGGKISGDIAILCNNSSATWSNMTTFYSLNKNNYIMDTIKLLGKVGKRILEKISYWVTEDSNWNYRIPEIWLSECFGLDRFTILPTRNFRYPSKNPFGSSAQTMNTLPVKESIGLDEVHRVMQKDITSRSMEQK